MAPMLKNIQILLKSYPKGFPTPENFENVTNDIPKDVTDTDDVLVQLLDLSVDPYLRGRMNPGPSYFPPFELGKVPSQPKLFCNTCATSALDTCQPLLHLYLSQS